MLPHMIVGLAVFSIFYYDGRFRRVPNQIVLFLVIFGIVFNCITQGLPGLVVVLAGALGGGALLVVPYFAGGVGAGDVKFAAAIGTVFGWEFIAAALLYGALFGGIWSVLILLSRRSLGEAGKSIFGHILFLFTGKAAQPLPLRAVNPSAWGFPYGVVIGLGVFTTWICGIPF